MQLCSICKFLLNLIILITAVNGQFNTSNEISSNRSESRSTVGMTPWSQCFVEGAESVLNNVNTNCESRLSPISMGCQKAFENGCNYQRNSLLCAKGMENALNDKSCRQDMDGNNDEAFYTCCQFCFKGILEAFFAKRCAPLKTEGFLRKIQLQCCQRQEPILLSERTSESADDKSGECKPGFALNHKTSKCDDIDECKLQMDNCEKGDLCFNTVGSFACRKKIKCDSGFKQSMSGFCVDINECESNEDNCLKSHEVCRNRIGSFDCECDVGFKRNRITEGCEDRNECLELFEPCRPTKMCENTIGSFNCICMPGYKDLNGNCTDIDECVETNICDRCINTEGSYRCLSCPEGSQLIGHTCSSSDSDSEKLQLVDDAVCTHKTFSAKCAEIICGRNYFKSPKADHVCIKKKKDSNPQHPLQISYAKVSVPSNVFIPKTGLSVYTIHRTKHEPLCEYWSSVIEAKDSRLATDEYWSFKFMDNSTTLKLLNPLKGPVEVRVTVDCKMNGFVLQRTIVIVYNN